MVRRGGIPAQAGIPVRVKDKNGALTAELDRHSLTYEAITANGQSFPTDAHGHWLRGPNPDYVEGLAFSAFGSTAV